MMERSQMGALLEHLAATLYGQGAVPPEEGGRLFRAVCDERRRVDDMFWTERRLQELARELGLWPWSVTQIQNAVGAPIRAASAAEAQAAAGDALAAVGASDRCGE